MTTAESEVFLRPADADDLALIERWVHRDVGERLQGLPDAVIWMQVRARAAHYAQIEPPVRTQMIVRGSAPCGFLLVSCGSGRMHVVDFFVRKSDRNLGVGAAVLRSLVSDADARSWPITLEVRTDNPAQRLYERTGFEVFDRTEVHVSMRRNPRCGPSIGHHPSL